MAKKLGKLADLAKAGGQRHEGNTSTLAAIDPRILTIARAIGRLIAKEQSDIAKSDSDI